MDDTSGATSIDTSRPVATAGDNDFTLSIEQVSERYAAGGHPRTIRTLQRYCASGHLDAQKIATTLGDKYLVTPLSVARHIAQIQELSVLDTVATRRDETRPAATPVAAQTSQEDKSTSAATPDDTSRQDATGNREVKEADARYISMLERDNEFLRDQVTKKDEQISNLSQRFGETQTLLGAMQRMLAPLLKQPDPFGAQPENREVREGQI